MEFATPYLFEDPRSLHLALKASQKLFYMLPFTCRYTCHGFLNPPTVVAPRHRTRGTGSWSIRFCIFLGLELGLMLVDKRAYFFSLIQQSNPLLFI